MPDEFRFMLICLRASHRLDDQAVTLSGIVNTLVGRSDEPTELLAMLGVILRPPMRGKRLDLMAWRLGNNGERLTIGDYVGTQMTLPDEPLLGPQVLPCEILLPTPGRGIYGFELFDGEGAFGTPERLLATYIFGVELDDAGEDRS